MSRFQELRLAEEDLVQNATARLPICVCIDTSYSMLRDQRMQQANEGIREFIKAIAEDPCAVDAVEMCIISFGNESAQVVVPFQPVDKINFKDLVPAGKTPLGQATLFAINELNTRNAQYDSYGISKYKPWLILISDGEATDDIALASQTLLKLQRDRDISVLCVGLGDEPNSLAELHMNAEVIHLEKFQLGAFFRWMSTSAARISKQSPQDPNMYDVRSFLKEGGK